MKKSSKYPERVLPERSLRKASLFCFIFILFPELRKRKFEFYISLIIIFDIFFHFSNSEIDSVISQSQTTGRTEQSAVYSPNDSLVPSALSFTNSNN